MLNNKLLLKYTIEVIDEVFKELIKMKTKQLNHLTHIFNK